LARLGVPRGICNLGLGIVAQGDKQVLLGGESIDYGPGESMLTTIDHRMSLEGSRYPSASGSC